jgi:uncharacterized membrane protein HdeD (DUF308 family)
MKSLGSILSRGWWLLLVRGLAAMAFGMLIWFQPAISLAALVLLFGAYATVDGVFGVWTAVRGRNVHDDWVIVLLEGLLGVGVGILTVLVPGITALALLFYIAIRAIGTGVLEIGLAVRLRKEIRGEWALMLAGLASIVFGVVAVARPATGALVVLWLIACYAIVFGVSLLVLAFRTRRLAGALAPA